MSNIADKWQREYDLLDPKLLQYIGVATTNWAALEFYINDCIWSLAKVAQAMGACMTAQIYTIDGRLKALGALLRLRKASDGLIAKVNAFAENLRGPGERRNRLIHDPWGRNPDGSTTKIEVTANRRLKFEQLHVDLAEVKKDVDSILEAVAQFIEIRDAILAALPTLPEIPPEALAPIEWDQRR